MRLLLADDHTLFRDALVQYIHRTDPGIEMLLAKDFYEAFDIVQANPDFDLILLDLRMPGMNGLDGLRQIRQTYPDVPVAIMSGIAEPSDVKQAMEDGAYGYFPKTLSGKALMKAIQLVLAGEKFLPIDHNTNTIMPSYRADPGDGAASHADGAGAPSGTFDIYNPVSNDRHTAPSSTANLAHIDSLTPRERDVLSYLVKGSSNKEIARELGLQVVTIKLHVRGICKKLGAQNRTQAALKAKELRLV